MRLKMIFKKEEAISHDLVLYSEYARKKGKTYNFQKDSDGGSILPFLSSEYV